MRRIGVVALLLSLPTPGIAQPSLDRPVPTLDTGGHVARVWKVLFTPDGGRLVTVSEDKTVRVWDVKSGATARTLRPPFGPAKEGTLYAAALSPDGNTLAIGGISAGTAPGSIYLINLATGRLDRELQGHNSSVVSLDFARVGCRLCSGSHDRTVRIWDTHTGRCEQVLKGHTRAVDGAVFSPDGLLLATSSQDKTGSVWRVATGERLATLNGHEREVWCVAWSPDGRTLATGSSDCSIRLWSPDGTCHQHIPHLHNSVLSLSFTPDGREVLVTRGYESNRYYCSMLTLARRRERVWFKGHSGPVATGALSPDGKLAATAGERGEEVYVWSTFDASVVHRLAGKIRPAGAAAWSPDGQRVAWGHADQRPGLRGAPLERSFDLAGLRLGRPGDEPFRGAQFTLGTLTLDTEGDQVVIRDSAGKTSPLPSLPEQHPLRCLTLLGGERVALGTDAGLYLVDVRTIPRQTGLVKPPLSDRWLRTQTPVWAVAPSPDGRHPLSASADGSLQVWQPEWNEPLLSVAASGDDWVAWTPEGYHAGSPGGRKLLTWCVHREAADMASYAPTHAFVQSRHRPDIVAGVARALGGKPVSEDRAYASKGT